MTHSSTLVASSLRQKFLKAVLITVSILVSTIICVGQKSKWKSYIGIEAGGDLGLKTVGLSTLKAKENPLVSNDLDRNYAFEFGLYADFFKLRNRSNSTWGNKMPGFGIRTGVNWTFFRADNSADGGGESLGFNYANVPLLLEICVGYKQGVTSAYTTPGTTTYKGTRNSDGSVTVTESSTNSTYSPGGAKTSGGALLYFGPQYSYLAKSFHSTESPIANTNLNKNYVSIVGGIIFWMNLICFDFSYQKGLNSIYNGKDITIDGFVVKLGINFNRRLYN